MKRNLKIAIVGGGIGGLTAACALQGCGFEVDVYERASELREVGAGLQLGPNAVKVLDALGFGPALRKVACEPPDMVSLEWHDASLRYRQPLGRVAERQFGAKYLTAHRADLYGLLVDRLGHAGVHLGEACSGVAEVGSTAVAKFETGREVEADIVIGADGIRSRVRQILFDDDKPRFTGQLGWRAVLPMERVPKVGPNRDISLREDFVGFLGPKGHVIMYPIRAGRVLNVFAGYFLDEWAEESWTVPSSAADMMAAFAGWDEQLLEMMSGVEHVYKWGLFDRDPLARWSMGRITLLGDAAHPMMPTLAQGAAITIEDACAIARHLDGGAGDPREALLAYERERQPRASRVQLTARQQYLNNKMVPSPPPLSRDWIFIHDATTGRDWSPAAA
jgi:salicylate hydroxylase